LFTPLVCFTGEQVTLDVDLIEADRFPNSIRFRGEFPQRLQQFKDPTFFKKGQMKAGYLIVVDATASRLGYPVQDLDDLVERLTQGRLLTPSIPQQVAHNICCRNTTRRDCMKTSTGELGITSGSLAISPKLKPLRLALLRTLRRRASSCR
jgi:hypothetical protein